MSTQIVFSPRITALFGELASRSDITSVSFSYDDVPVWLALADAQRRKSSALRLPPSQALELWGPDHGLPVDLESSDIVVHTPYEGAAEADFFINPPWRGCMMSRAMLPGNLTFANWHKPTKILALLGTHQDVDSATRILIDGWTVYFDRALE